MTSIPIPTTTSTSPKTLDLRGVTGTELHNLVNIAVVTGVAGWTQHRNIANGKCGCDIPKGEATLWEYGFVPPQYDGDTNYRRKVPDYATSMDVVLPLLPPRFDCFANPAYGFKIIIDNGPDFPSWSEGIATTLPLAACYALLSSAGYTIWT